MIPPKISAVIVYKNDNNLKECIESVLQQSMSNIEAVCVNNGAAAAAEKTAQELASKIDRIKLISLPAGLSSAQAKLAGLSAASGDYVIFIENNEIVSPDFMKTIYHEAQNEKKTELKNKYLYKRSFLEYERELSNIAEDAVKIAAENIDEKLQKKFDDFYKNNTENIKNSAYELSVRFNQLEKQFYDCDWQNKERISSFENTNRSETDAKLHNVYEDIHKVYDYINSEINKKGSEIGRVYEEITKNYKYTEKLAEEKFEQAAGIGEEKILELENRINQLEKEIIIRYQNLKRIMDIQLDEIKTSSGAQEGGR